MDRFPLRLALAVLLSSVCALARGADLYVICNSSVSLTATDVHDMFLGEKQFTGATRLVPIDNSAAQQLFLDKVLKMSAARYSTTWTKKSFRDGINPPRVAGSDLEAVAYVRRTPGACSYTATPVSSDVVLIRVARRFPSRSTPPMSWTVLSVPQPAIAAPNCSRWWPMSPKLALMRVRRLK
jgi:hypothetical protein